MNFTLLLLLVQLTCLLINVELQMELEENLSIICPAAMNSAVILFDLETTGNTNGIFPQEIIQIGCWEMLTNAVFESLVKPSNYKFLS